MTRTRLLVGLVLAVLLALVFFGYRTYVLQYSNENLAAAYYTPPEIILPAQDSTAYYEGMRWLREDGYVEATEALNRVARTDADYPSAQYYAGHAYYRNEQLNAAMTALQNATGIGPSNVREDAEWLLLLTYLRSGRTERNFFTLLDKVGRESGHRYAAQVAALRSDLTSSWRSRWEEAALGRGGY